MGGYLGNDALNVNTNTQNGKHVDIAITVRGSDWYWTVTAVMVCATFAFIGLGLTKPRTHRIFHYITAAITMVAAIAYFSMASNLGWTPIDVEFRRANPIVHGVNREIFYVRYIDWFITTPLLLLDLLLTAAMPWPTLMFVILVDEIMIITGLVGALVKSSYKWGYYCFGCVALFYIVYTLAWDARKQSRTLGEDVGRAFLYCGALTTFLWTLYPLAWGLCEGGNVISPDSEAIFYGILDLFAKPVFGALLLWGHRGIEPSRLGLEIRDYTGDDHAIRDEKHPRTGRHDNGTNGVNDTSGVSTGVNRTNDVAGQDATATNGHHHAEPGTQTV